MIALVWLTVLQALVVNAIPHRRRQACSTSAAITTHTNTTTAQVATVTLAPRQSANSLNDSPRRAKGIIPLGTVEESSNGVIYVPSYTLTSSTFSSPISPTASASGVETPSAVSTAGTLVESISTTAVTPSVSVIILLTSSRTTHTLPSPSTVNPGTQHLIFTSVTASGSGPVPNASITAPTTIIPAPTTIISAPTTIISATAPAISITSTVNVGVMSDNIFQPVATNAPPSVLGTRTDHPVPRLGIQPQKPPIGTNKFYANFFLGSQSSATWTHPYSLAWSKGGGSSGSFGMSISHINDSQKVFGPNPAANPVEYFLNPVGSQSLVLSAAELGASTTISMDSLTAFSANVNLLPSPGAAAAITFPLVQGMAFVTGIYQGGTPILQTGVFFRSLTKVVSPKAGVTKYSILLDDGTTWFLYAYSPAGIGLDFTVISNGLAQATSTFTGFIQIAKNPGGAAEALYDAACGAYPTTVILSGSANGAAGSYTLSFAKAGIANVALAMFALPHHVASFDPTTKAAVTTVQLDTTTKGVATAVVADSWTLVEDLPTSMNFAPWSPSIGSGNIALSSAATAVIHGVAQNEVSQNMSQQTNLNSMYYSGKALAKFAGIIYTIHDLLQDQALAQTGLAKLKACFAVFASNTQQFSLVYETAWGGVVSDASYVTGNSGDDFGNTYYNDHHFHYGYFIYTAAVIGYLDPSWLSANKDYVNSLVRDIANPSTDDSYFPVSRMFDWYHGHSWAHGLYETADGKDEESSSEDSMSAYAIKMWGRTIGDSNMEARGNLQLAVTARSLQSYFLYESSNTVEPANFIGNKVSGILFENKIDHTTYFGTNIEYIQGIHMLPLLPSSTLTRTQEFVTEEWNTYFSNGRVDSIAGGWRGVLYANLAIIQPQAAWTFFSQANFDASLLDGGASLTWYLALAAGLGGV